VKGEAVPVADENIAAGTDLSKVRKYYKLNGLNWLDGVKNEQQKHKEMEMLIVQSMALRGL
jgi:EKC/KEOPS complex subunit CGI121/TPRKB